MAENILVIIIVAVVALIAGRSLFRTITGKQGGCGALTCRGCACSKSAVIDLGQNKKIMVAHTLPAFEN